QLRALVRLCQRPGLRPAAGPRQPWLAWPARCRGRPWPHARHRPGHRPRRRARAGRARAPLRPGRPAADRRGCPGTATPGTAFRVATRTRRRAGPGPAAAGHRLPVQSANPGGTGRHRHGLPGPAPDRPLGRAAGRRRRGPGPRRPQARGGRPATRRRRPARRRLDAVAQARLEAGARRAQGRPHPVRSGALTYQRLRFIPAGIAPCGSLRVATATIAALDSRVPTTRPVMASRPRVETLALARSEARPTRTRSAAVWISLDGRAVASWRWSSWAMVSFLQGGAGMLGAATGKLRAAPPRPPPRPRPHRAASSMGQAHAWTRTWPAPAALPDPTTVAATPRCT